MVLKVRKLLTEHQKVVNEISHILIEGNFYLAGGTALFYYFKMDTQLILISLLLLK